jgi:hypothetical protein
MRQIMLYPDDETYQTDVKTEVMSLGASLSLFDGLLGAMAVHPSAFLACYKLPLTTVAQLLSVTVDYGNMCFILLDLQHCRPTHNPLVGGSNPSGPTNPSLLLS